MRAIIIIITLCLISGQVLCISVIGCSGGSVMIKCLSTIQRESDDQFEGKYFCRDRYRYCTTGVHSEFQRRWVNNGRFSLYDDGHSRFFSVFIRKLSREDAGKYTCGNNQKWSRDVTLVVNGNSSSCGTSVIKSAYIGQTITFSCEYEDGFEKRTKVLYRVNTDPVLVLNISQSSRSSEEKFTLTDDQKHHFTVTIRDVSADDGGVYLCGVERYASSQKLSHITFIKEIELHVNSPISSVQIEAYISKSVFITCVFTQERKRNKKFLQKGPSQKTTVDEQNRWVSYGNVQMYDDTSEGVLKVFIRDLSAADEGTYRCGVKSADDHLFTEFRLEINQVDHFHASSESAVIGESVKLSCDYPEKQKTVKHICKENEEEICESISSSEFSDVTGGVFTASISNVRLRDAGVYWCGAETRHEHLTSVSLTNKHQLTLYMPPVISREGDSAEIKCPYDDEERCLRNRKCLNKEIKYLCKGKCFTQDAKIIIQSDEGHVKKPNISVKDDTELRLFTVTVTELRAEDAGKYWCAVKDEFNLPVELMIIRKNAVSREASVGESVSISCEHIKHSQTLFCRGDQPSVCVRDGVRVSSRQKTNGRFSLTEDTSAGVFTVNIRDLRAEDSGKYWCVEESSGSFIFTEVQLRVTREMITSDTKRETSQEKEKPEMTSSDTKKETGKSGFPVAAAVSVGLILLALVVALILFKLKHNKRELIPPSDRRQTGDNQTAQEQIARHHSDSDPESAHLYSTVQSPTTPSDGLLYSAVSFQDHEESLGDATVRFRKEDIQCDYASVNHSIMPD